MAPDFLELGGGVVQFPQNFFNAGDTAKFYVGYGMVNQSNAPITINNIMSANDTLGSVVVPTGFTLDKPYMNVPAGAIISGAGAVSSDGAITGPGVIATTGLLISRGVQPTQPSFDYIREKTLGKGTTFPNNVSIGGTLTPSGGIVGISTKSKTD